MTLEDFTNTTFKILL